MPFIVLFIFILSLFSFTSLTCHPRFYLYPIWVNFVSDCVHTILGPIVLCFLSLWYYPSSSYKRLFLVPLGSNVFDGVLSLAYVRCSSVWFPSIGNYRSLFVCSFCFSSLEHHPMNLFQGTPYSFCLLRISSFLKLLSGIPFLEFVYPPSRSLSLFGAYSFLECY